MAEEDSAHKKRRLQRACDFCRKKKIRCDGVQTSNEDNKCSNCKLYHSTCTYVATAQKRDRPSTTRSYVETLEDRVERMDSLLSNLVGETTKRHHNTIASSNSPPFQPVSSSSTSASSSPSSITSQPPAVVVAANVASSSGDESDGDDFINLTDNFRMMDVETDSWSRFFGKSSSAQLVQTALELKNGTASSDVEDDANVCNWLTNPVCDNMRPEFSAKPYWEDPLDKLNDDLPAYVFPEDDLFKDLVNVYFKTYHLMHPLLHRPTFDKALQAKLHRKHAMFGGIVLLVCAIAARFSQDPRVLLDNETSRRSSGWKYFSQVNSVRRSLLAPPTIYDLQFYALYSNFLFGTSAPQACWAVIGMGIRLAQDVGAHRKKKSNGPTVEDELWKRAFWSLVSLDRDASLALGRPAAIQDDDIDVEFPIECDDEFWEHPDPQKAFKQPPGKPSVISFFVSELKLYQIIGTCLRTLYSPNKARLRNVDKDWEQNTVTELDSMLNQWVDCVPEHLRWDPHREDEVFFNQSVALFTSYYNIQILIHKPFIPSPRNTSPLTFPSLAICTNAARSCSHIVDIQRQRGFFWGQPFVVLNVFAAAIVLLLNIWGGKRTRMNLNPVKEMLDVHKCMQVLRDMENTWHFSGRLWDILYQLASVGDLPLPTPVSPQSLKRRRDAEPEEQIPVRKLPPPLQSSPPDAPAHVAPMADTYPHPMTADEARLLTGFPTANGPIPAGDWPPIDFDLGLPIRSADLGRMPVHPGVRAPPPTSLDMIDHGWTFDNVPQDAFSFGFPEPAMTQADGMMDDSTLDLWANIPNGLELDDWASFLAKGVHGP